MELVCNKIGKSSIYSSRSLCNRFSGLGHDIHFSTNTVLENGILKCSIKELSENYMISIKWNLEATF